MTSGGEHGQDQNTVTLLAPNGADHIEHVHNSETVGELLKKAVNFFGSHKDLDPTAEYILVANGVALENSLTLEQVHLAPGARVSVRSKAPPVDGCIRS